MADRGTSDDFVSSPDEFSPDPYPSDGQHSTPPTLPVIPVDETLVRNLLGQWMRRNLTGDTSSWSIPTDEEKRLLKRLIRALIQARYTPNLDGEYPLEFVLIDNEKEFLPGFLPIPYSRSTSKLIEAHRRATVNLSIAKECLEDISHRLREHLEDVVRMQSDL